MRLVSIATLTTVLSMSTASQRFVFPDDEVFFEKLAEEKAERIATILSILHKCGMAKSCDDAFVEKMKPDQVDDLIHIGMEDLMRCGVKKLAARSISRKLPGAVKQFQKKKGAS